MSLKIVTFNGSFNKEGKTSQAIILIHNYLFKELEGFQLNIEVLNSEMEPIMVCESRKKCFSEGFCPLDYSDSMMKIKRQILESDIVMISSPVYANNVSGYAKNFIDRLSYWEHLMPLAGKLCILLVVAQNDVDYTSKYLYEVASFMGLTVIGLITIDGNTNENKIMKQVENITNRIIQHVTGGKIVKMNIFLNNIFQSFNYIYGNIMTKDSFEYQQWRKNGNLNFSSFQQVIDKKYDEERDNINNIYDL